MSKVFRVHFVLGNPRGKFTTTCNWIKLYP
jgi:hypothetical protein